MARSFLTSLNLNKNELINARIQNLAEAPANPVKGQVYFDTVFGALREYNGTVWKTMVHAGDIVNADIAADAAIAISKLAIDPNDRANHFNTQLSETISDFDDAVQSNTLDSLTAPVANVDLNNWKITNLATPVDPLDAANKQYVDASRSGLDVKQSVRVATTEDIELSGVQTIDGVELEEGDRVLVKNQENPIENGIYIVSEEGWERSDDADDAEELSAGVFFFVEEGDENADSGFVLTSDGSVTVGSDPLAFTQFSGTGQITTGDGLVKDGNIINVVGTENRITVNDDSVDISADYVGQTSITTLGTVTTGTWNATTIAVADGGTGATNAWDARVNLEATTKYSVNNPLLTAAGGQVTWVVTHNLETRDVVVQVRDLLTNSTLEVDVTMDTVDTVTLQWVSNVSVDEDTLRVVVIG
jgi:hypothetical protein